MATIKNLVLVVFFCLCWSFTGCSEHKPKPNVIVLLLDTLRADHLSVHGYQRNTSPILDAFAKENIWCKNAITAAPWTPASVASIFTGLYPITHGMMPPNDRTVARKSSEVLDDRLETLSEKFKAAGYQTAAVSSNPWIGKAFKFDQGFDSFKEIVRAQATEVTNTGVRVIERLAKTGDPFFLYLHYLDPHDPYAPPDAYKKMFDGELKDLPVKYDAEHQKNINLYDGEIKYLDDQVGRLFSHLKQQNLYQDAVIVVVGDHGEQFFEHGDDRHGYRLHNEEIHVPLMIRAGNRAHREIEQTVSTVDIAPTLLELAGLKSAENMPGVSLVSANLSQRAPVLSEIRRHYDFKSITTTGGEKLIMTVDFKKSEIDPELSNKRWKESPKIFGVYERQNDYYEQHPDKNADKHAALIKAFKEIYAAAESAQVGGGAMKKLEVSEDTLKELESLGYMN